MKKILLFLVCLNFFVLLSFGQTNETVFDITNGNIVTKSKFIKEFFKTSNKNITPYILWQNVAVSTPVSKTNYTLKLSKLNGYQNEPGDFHVINVMKNNTTVLELINPLGWVKMSSNNVATSDVFLKVDLGNDRLALLFTAYIDASNPSELTIVVIDNQQAKLVFNKNYYINSFTQTANSFSMELQSNTLEYVSGNTPVNSPILHEIWLENGVLKFRDK